MSDTELLCHIAPIRPKGGKRERAPPGQGALAEALPKAGIAVSENQPRRSRGKATSNFIIPLAGKNLL